MGPAGAFGILPFGEQTPRNARGPDRGSSVLSLFLHAEAECTGNEKDRAASYSAMQGLKNRSGEQDWRVSLPSQSDHRASPAKAPGAAYKEVCTCWRWYRLKGPAKADDRRSHYHPPGSPGCEHQSQPSSDERTNA